MNKSLKTPNAWVHRVSPSGVDQLWSICLPKDQIVTGWSIAGLETISDRYEMRKILKENCYRDDKTFRRAGGATSSMWKFIHEMAIGDYVVVPHHDKAFFLAQITGNLKVDKPKSAYAADSIHRRQVEWLNGKEPIPRDFVKSGLRSKMKIRQTTATASEFVADIETALALASGKAKPDQDKLFSNELRQKLIKTMLGEIHSGYMSERKFEELIAVVLSGMGAKDCEIIPRRKDKGVDVRVQFLIGPTEIVIGVQAKWHKGTTQGPTGWMILSMDS